MAEKKGVKIYTLIRAQTGNDFTLYKLNTVMRRIHKRMAIHQIGALDDYVVYLRSNPHEIEILFIVDTARDPFLVLDSDLTVLTANRSFYDNFKTVPGETEKRPVFELGNGQWDIPALKLLLRDALSTDKPFENYEVEHEFPGIGRKKMLLNARRIRQEGTNTETILPAIEDVTRE